MTIRKYYYITYNLIENAYDSKTRNRLCDFDCYNILYILYVLNIYYIYFMCYIIIVEDSFKGFPCILSSFFLLKPGRAYLLQPSSVFCRSPPVYVLYCSFSQAVSSYTGSSLPSPTDAVQSPSQWRRPGAEFGDWGGTEKNFAAQDF